MSAPLPWTLASGDLLSWLGDRRVSLEGTGAVLADEVDGEPGERTAETAVPETRTGNEAGHGPEAIELPCAGPGPLRPWALANRLRGGRDLPRYSLNGANWTEHLSWSGTVSPVRAAYRP